ncbi:MAG: SDR family NAD(P)-dependent oxidoreductase [Hyphomicrobiaceae bacterium]
MTDIAIIGIGCRLPGDCDDAGAFHSFLARRGTAIREIPANRWSLPGFYDPSPDRPARSYAKWGGFLGDIKGFDADFFELSRREAAAMDPQQRLLLMVCVEAAQDAGVPLAALAGARTGVYVGVSNVDYGLLQRYETGVGDIQAGTGTALSIVANRVSNRLDLRGPSMGIDTACSSSLVALHTAVEALRRGEIDLAYAAGVNVLLDPRMFVTFSHAHMLSPRGRISAFDAEADGFVRGEGVGAVLLKPLAAALRDGNRIYATVRASAVNQDGATGTITAPSAAAQAAMIRAALANAGARPEDIAYVEAHGTGTPLGDPIEAEAIGSVLGVCARRTPLPIGSVKTNIGHLEPAAGIASIIKTALMLEAGRLLPSLNCTHPNPRIPFAALNIRVVIESEPLSGEGDTALALVNGFGFGGTNAAALLAPPPKPRSSPVHAARSISADAEATRADALVPVPLSAPTQQHLAAWARRLAEALTPGAPLSGTPVEALAARLAGERDHHAFRAVVLAAHGEDLRAKLLALADGRDWPKADKRAATELHVGRAVPPSPLVFTCTGQGGQFWNMGRDLLHSHAVFRDFVERFDDLFAPRAGWSVVAALLAAEHESRLHDAAITPAVMFCLQAGLAEAWKALGIEPDIVIGHSFGEVTAAYLAGGIPLADVAHLVNHRGLIRHEIRRIGGMAAIGMGADELAHFLPGDGSIEIGAFNAPDMVTVSGERAAIVDLIARLERHDPGLLARLLDLDFAWHSSWLDPGEAHFKDAVGALDWQAPRLPVISTVTGRLQSCFDADYWWQNLRQPVRFDAAVNLALTLGARTFVELGPSRTLSSPTASVAGARGIPVTTVSTLNRGQPDRTSFAAAAATLHVTGRTVSWPHRPSGERVPAALPFLPWRLEPLWNAPEEAHRALQGGEPHAFLGARLPGPDWRWQSEISLAGLPFLADHRIGETVVLPAAVIIEILRAAAAEALASETLELRNLELREALFLGPDDRIELTTTFDDERSRLTIWSRAKGEDTYTRRADVEAFAANALSAGLAAVETDSAVSGAAFYAACAALGYGYGPAFQRLTQLRRDRAGRIAATLTRPAPDGIRLAGVVLDPRTLDGALQAVIGARHSEVWQTASGLRPATLAMPTRIAAIRCGSACDEATEVRVRDDGAGLGLTVAAGAGPVLIEIDGLEMAAAGFQGTAPDAAPSTIVETFEVFAQLADAAPASDSWLFLASEAGDEPWPRAPIAVLPASPAAWQASLEAMLDRASQPGVQGLVYLSAAAREPTSAAADGAHVAVEVERLTALGRVLAARVASAAAGRATLPPIWIATHLARTSGSGDHDRAPDLAGAALLGLARTIAAECPTCEIGLIDLDDDARRAPHRLADALAHLGAEREAALRGNVLLVPRLVVRERAEIAARTLRAEALPEAAGYRLAARGVGFETLAWEREAPVRPGPGEIVVEVAAAGLNFRDVMLASGLLPAEAESGPGARRLGLEFAGRVSALGAGVEGRRIGDHVLGMAKGAFSRRIVVPAAAAAPVPAGLTALQAAALPSVYLTAYYALAHLARLAPGERLLVHAGTGGVGLAAIAVARHLGADVLATAGSPEKRAYLEALGVRRVMDSRTLDFAAETLAETDGAGVDVVLNAQAGAWIEKSLACLAPYGRFIELGKRDVYADRSLGLKALRNNVSLHVVDLARLVDDRPALARRLLDEVLGLIADGRLPPLPVESFPASRSDAAFRHLAEARHIGKVVLDMSAPGLVAAAPAGQDVPLDPGGAYLVTGGTSGLGLAIAERLAAGGAGRVVLAARRPPSPEAEAVVARLAAGRAEIETLPLDVTDAAAVATAIGALSRADRPLRGIVHAAVVYADALLPDTTAAGIGAVLAPKLTGALNLTEAVVAAAPRLDFFVSLSSLAEVVGWPGQSSYAAANAGLEALAQRQRRLGLPGVTINLGMISDLGFVARSSAMTSYLESAGWRPIPAGEAAAAVLRLAGSAPSVVTFAAADWSRLAVTQTALARSPRLSRLLGAASDTASQHRGLTATPPAERRAAALDLARQAIARVLRLAPETLDEREPLARRGLDSLSSFELRNRLEATAAMPIPLPRFSRAASLGALADLLVALAGEREVSVTVATSPTIAPATAAGTRAADRVPLLPRQAWVLAQVAAPLTTAAGRMALTTVVGLDVDGRLPTDALGRELARLAERHPLLAMAPATAGAGSIMLARRRDGPRLVATPDIASAVRQGLPADEGLRLLVQATGDTGTRLAVVASRALLDDWSAALLLEQLLAGVGLPVRPTPLCDWWDWRHPQTAEGGDESYWRQRLGAPPPRLHFQRRARPELPCGFGLDAGPGRRLQTTLSRSPGTAEADCLAAYLAAIAAVTGCRGLLVAICRDGRATAPSRGVLGPLARRFPVVASEELLAAPGVLAATLARQLALADQAPDHDLAAAEMALAGAWQHARIAPGALTFRWSSPDTAPPTPRLGSDAKLWRPEDWPSDAELALTVTYDQKTLTLTLDYDAAIVDDALAQGILARLAECLAAAAKQGEPASHAAQ